MELQFGIFPQVFLLVLARIAAIIGSTAFFGGNAVSKTIKLAIALAITLCVMPTLPESWIEATSVVRTMPDVILAITGEIMMGLTIGLICTTIIDISMVGGQIIGQQSAMAMARELNPMTGIQNPIYAILMQKIFILIVLLNGGHLLLLQMVGKSFAFAAPQMGWMNLDLVTSVISLGSVMFEWGLRLAAPVLGAAMILNVALGLMSRLAPNFNILFLSLPIRVFTGIACLGLILRFGSSFFARAIEQMMAACASVLTG
jgi:flagellar biosynthetic protein FliR